MALYLVRHGQTQWNRAGRLQGQLDSPLTVLGFQQVLAFGQRLARELAGAPTPVVVASPLGRAAQSAAIVAEQLAIPFENVRFEPLLKERNQGVYDGLTAVEIQARFSPDPQHRRRWNYAAPAGESLAQVHARACQFLSELPESQVTVAVCHGVVSRVLRGAYLSLPSEQIRVLEPHEQDRIFRLGDGRVDTLLCPLPERLER